MGTTATQEHPNATLIREGLEAFNRRDMQAYADLVADDIVWHQIGSPEPIRGKAALAEQMTMNTDDFEIEAEVHDVVANDEHGIALVNATARRGDQTFHYRTAEILHMRDGKIVERWAFSDDTQAINEFFA
jgi:ketosteroid isomerase-like protein